MSECKARCGTELIWRKHQKTGKSMPIEAEPHPKGNLILNGDGKTFRLAGGNEYVANYISDAAPKLYISHFARCPKADNFRK